MGGGASASERVSKATAEELKAAVSVLTDDDKMRLKEALARSIAASKRRERLEMVFKTIADADGYVTVEGLTRVIMCMGAAMEDAQREARQHLGGADRMLASELAAGDLGAAVACESSQTEKMLSMMESAVYGGSRVSDARFVDATAFAAADGDECTKLLKEKVGALFKVMGIDEPGGFTKDQFMKYALGLAQSGALAAAEVPTDAPELIRELVDNLFRGLDTSCDGKVTQEEAFNYALKTLLDMAGCSSIAAMDPGMKMGLMMAVGMYCDLLLGAGTATGSERLAEITKMLRTVFDAADLNGNGFLERDELKAGCLTLAKRVAELSGGAASVEEGVAEMELMLDGFIAEADKGKTGKLCFEDMLAASLPGLCDGQEPEKFFAEMDPTMFTTIKMQLDMYLGGFLKK